MENHELLDYVNKLREFGANEVEIKKKLIEAGWSEELINSALRRKTDLPLPPIPPNQTHKSENMWDVFEHCLLFISLYVLSTSLTLTVHLIVDKFIPPISASSYSTGYFNSILLQMTSAALIVSFPLFAFFLSNISKRTIRNPFIRHMKARKILIYLTLIVTFIILMANLISLLFTFLGGNVSGNFFLKFLVTLFVYGFIFAYYVYQVREDSK